MFCELRLDGQSRARRTSQQLTKERRPGTLLAGLHIVIRGKIFVRKYPDTGARGGNCGIVELGRTARQQAAEVHFELGEPRRKSGIA